MDNSKVLIVPYVKEVSNDIKQIVKYVIDVQYTILKKLYSIIRNGKNSLKNYQMMEIVYKISCEDCDQVYIGQIKRYLETRIKEHRRNIKNPSGTFLSLRTIDYLLITILNGINQTYCITQGEK